MDDLQYSKLSNMSMNYLKENVLNLVINGWPSILLSFIWIPKYYYEVLNLVINGWPSILKILGG